MKSSALSEELTEYTKVCALDDLKESEGKRYIIDDIDIAVFRIGGNVYAVNNRCPHQQSALIYDGFVEKEFVVCPAHGWIFSLKDGQTPSGTKGLDTYDVKISDNHVFVKVTQKNWNW